MNKLQHYQKYKIWYETLIITSFFTLNAALLSTTIIMEDSRAGNPPPYPIWVPFVNEYSSSLILAVLMPALAWFLSKFPFNWQNIKQTLMTYLLGSLIFSAVHVSAMVALRKIVYWTQATSYQMGDLTFQLIFEYRKDLMTFTMLVTAIIGYRFILSRLVGEANLIGNDEVNALPRKFDRLLVKKLGKEFIINVADIEWLESSGNYVNLHIKGRVYPTRATLGGLIDKVSDKGLCRIHRSHGVNLNSIDSITPLNSGDSEVKLKNGKVLNLSRRYKDNLKSQLR